MKTGDLFRGSSLQHQVLALSDFYSNRGYAYVNVDPRTQLVLRLASESGDPAVRKAGTGQAEDQ